MQNLAHPSQDYSFSNSKKKYSKVNEALRTRFLDYIVQDNMSIKEVLTHLPRPL